jgi:hypothetical protein
MFDNYEEIKKMFPEPRRLPTRKWVRSRSIVKGSYCWEAAQIDYGLWLRTYARIVKKRRLKKMVESDGC